MKPSMISMLPLLAVFGISNAADSATEDVSLPEVNVIAEKYDEPSYTETSQPRSQETVTPEGIRIYAGPAQTNAYKALSGLPSVMFEGADPYGLSGTRSIRSRGRPNSSQSPGQTYEGMPIRNLGGYTGSVDLFDLENVSALDFFRGAAPLDKGVGFANAAGSVDMTFRRPADEMGAFLSFSAGSYNFRRIFARVDSGLLPSGTRFFVSKSHTEADKWRGEGQSPQGRQNTHIGITQQLTDNLRLELFGVTNNQRENEYRSLTYDQAKNLSKYHKFDYNNSLTGNPAEDVNYYGFNRNSSKDKIVFGSLRFDNEKISAYFKAYYWDINGQKWYGSSSIFGSPGVTSWEYDSKVYGLVSQIDGQVFQNTEHEIRAYAGYWFNVQEPPGPPLHQRGYQLGSDGSLTFSGWTTLSKMSNHIHSSPYAGLRGTSGAWVWNIGARYLHYRTPSITYFDGEGLVDSSYRDAFEQNPETSPDRHASSRKLINWLPNIGLSYQFSSQAQVYANYGRNYGVPAFGIATVYNNSRSRFVAAGATLQDLWNKANQELSDNYDLGLHLSGPQWNLHSVIYYARYRSVQVDDPVLNLSYSQNAGRARSYGFETEGNWSPQPQLILFGGFSLSRFELTEDTRVASGTILQTRGKQIADSPHLLAKMGLSYRLGRWTMTPTVRYVGKRYGNAMNTEKVPSYTVADFNLSYSFDGFPGAKQAMLELSVSNIFNRRYIGIISSNDVNLSNGASYYPGAPRAVAATFSVSF